MTFLEIGSFKKSASKITLLAFGLALALNAGIPTESYASSQNKMIPPNSADHHQAVKDITLAGGDRNPPSTSKPITCSVKPGRDQCPRLFKQVCDKYGGSTTSNDDGTVYTCSGPFHYP